LIYCKPKSIIKNIRVTVNQKGGYIIYIGLEFIIDFYNLEKSDFANEIGISKQQLNSWLKGARPIPTKWLDFLSNKFEIDRNILSKDLDTELKLELYRILLSKLTDNQEEIDFGIEVQKMVYKRSEMLENNIDRIYNLILNMHKKVMSNNSDIYTKEVAIISSNIEEKMLVMIDKFISILEENNSDKLKLLSDSLNELVKIE
jgi:hypothetical protein